MKFLVVFALFAVVCVAALPASPTNSIIAAVESSKDREQHPLTTSKPPLTLQGIPHRPIPHRNTFIAAAGALITKFVRKFPKVISGDIPKAN